MLKWTKCCNYFFTHIPSNIKVTTFIKFLFFWKQHHAYLLIVTIIWVESAEPIFYTNNGRNLSRSQHSRTKIHRVITQMKINFVFNAWALQTSNISSRSFYKILHYLYFTLSPVQSSSLISTWIPVHASTYIHCTSFQTE